MSITHTKKNMDQFTAEIESLFTASLEAHTLFDLSKRLQAEFSKKLKHSDISMLPSFHHALPEGTEIGTYLALDMGGSNFRLALVDLLGREQNEDHMQVKRMKTFPIDSTVRALDGTAFFEWVADRIEEMLSIDKHVSDGGSRPLYMGLAWSFPIEQTSAKSGYLLQMGKGFSATNGVQGRDLCDLIMTPCTRRGLNVQLQSIVNDSSATLLAEAYSDPATRISLILGTGTNSAIFLPVSALSRTKFGTRPQSWFDIAERVIVNTELSMYGKNTWPTTKWDDALNKTHEMPDFQPLEYLVGGRYLGEIVRMILMEAIQDAGLFDGDVPSRFNEPYALEAGILAVFESDTTSNLSQASETFSKSHPTKRDPTKAELHFIRTISRLVSDRAAAFEAAAVHALWLLLTASEGHMPEQQERVTIACNGSVLEKYPTFRSRCQEFLDALTTLSGAQAGTVVLRMAPDSSVFGAAVAASCIEP